jgi:hypothetical protein
MRTAKWSQRLCKSVDTHSSPRHACCRPVLLPKSSLRCCLQPLSRLHCGSMLQILAILDFWSVAKADLKLKIRGHRSHDGKLSCAQQESFPSRQLVFVGAFAARAQAAFSFRSSRACLLQSLRLEFDSS